MTKLRKKYLKEQYDKLLKSGMFWEFYPEMTGIYEIDSKDWFKEIKKIEKNKIIKGEL